MLLQVFKLKTQMARPEEVHQAAVYSNIIHILIHKTYPSNNHNTVLLNTVFTQISK